MNAFDTGWLPVYIWWLLMALGLVASLKLFGA